MEGLTVWIVEAMFRIRDYNESGDLKSEAYRRKSTQTSADEKRKLRARLEARS
jgi:hypothetical protein